MPMFEYVAKDLSGKKIKGSYEAYNSNELNIYLKGRKLFLISSKVKKTKTKEKFYEPTTKISSLDIVLYIKQLSVMISAGISVESANRALAKQTKNKSFKIVLNSIGNELYKGNLFSQALEKYPKIFPPYFRNMVYIGEASGNLDTVLEKASEFYENDLKTKKKVKGAMIYPTFLFIAIAAVFTFLVIFIVPQFEETLYQLGTELPLITQIVMKISRFFQNYGLYILISIILFVLFMYLWFKTKTGTMVKDFIKLKTPFFGRIQYYLITTRFSKGLSILVSSGMNVMDSIELISRLMNNTVFEKKFQHSISEIKKGKRLSKSIESINFFPKMLVEMVNVGENTGNLEEVLDITSKFYDDRLEQTIHRSTQALEPIMIVFAGIIVGLVILSIFLPMISIIDSI